MGSQRVGHDWATEQQKRYGLSIPTNLILWPILMSQLTLTYLMYLFFLSKIVITVIRFFVRFENAILINDSFIVFFLFLWQ